MKDLIQNLIDLGYDPRHAETLYRFYEHMDDLEGLRELILMLTDEPLDTRYYYSY